MASKPVVSLVVLLALGVLGACGGDEAQVPADVVCGDGIVEGAEACDDGNTATEACAYGQTSCVVCDAGCREVAGAVSYCGDGTIDAANGEACDRGAANTGATDCAYGVTSCALCTTACAEIAGVPHVCGDGVRDDPDEQCDDGFVDACGTCNETCTGPGTGSTCGDGVICPQTEVCDDGAKNGYAPNACRPITCRPAACGDGVVDSGEACDDGNTIPLDGCSAVCAIEPGDDCSNLFDLVATGDQGNGTYVFRHDTRLLKNNFKAPDNRGAPVFGTCDGKTANWPDAVAVFTAPTAGSWTFATTSSFDVVLWLTDSCAPAGTTLTCADRAGYPAPGRPSDESTTVALTAGQTVYVFVDGYDSFVYFNAGPFTLTVTSP